MKRKVVKRLVSGCVATVFVLIVALSEIRLSGADAQDRKEAPRDAASKILEVEKFLNRHHWLDKWQRKMLQHGQDFGDLNLATDSEHRELCSKYVFFAMLHSERATHLMDLLQLSQFEGDVKGTADRLLKEQIDGFLTQATLNIKYVSTDMLRVKWPAIATALDKIRDDLRAFETVLKEMQSQVK